MAKGVHEHTVMPSMPTREPSVPSATARDLPSLVAALNRFDPREVQDSIDALGNPLDGGRADGDPRAAQKGEPAGPVVASGPLDFGAVQPGVALYDDGADRPRLRVNVAEVTGGHYAEIEAPRAQLTSIAERLLEILASRDGR